jgi:hypothetical protein
MVFRHADISQAENRTLARLPQLPRSLEQWQSFPQRFDAYFNDNFGLRKQLLRLNSNLSTIVLGRLPSDKVIFGKDKWLFFSGEGSIELYRNKRPLSSVQLDDAREALSLRVRRLAELKAPYLFFVVPDKHTLYPEKMPSFMVRRDPPSQLDQIVKMAKFAGLPLLDLRPALLHGKPDGLVYFKDDTHWTDWGAYLGYREVMVSLPLAELPILRFDYRQFSVPAELSGDLANMANLPWVERTVTLDPSANRCRVTIVPSKQLGSNLWVVRSQCSGAKYKVVYIGDSFTDRIVQYLGQSFGEVVYVIRSGFTPLRDIRPWVESEAPDLVIEELAERHVSSIAESLGGDQFERH